MLTRRDVAVRSIGAVAGGLLASRLPGSYLAAQEPQRADGQFEFARVVERARQLAEEPFDGDFAPLPERIADLDRDGYARIRFRPEAALWRGEELPFQLQLFHRGFIYERPVRINVVEAGSARPLVYSPDQFEFDPPEIGEIEGDIGFSGFRIHSPINLANVYDEVAVFQGGNSFRAVGKGQVYGLSARTVLVDAATGSPEDVPFFREFWIEKPGPGATEVAVYGLLDGESLAGACKFLVRPGEATVISVYGQFFIRRDVKKLGLAPLVSMFLYGEDGSRRFDDPRPEIHDSDGLLMCGDSGNWMWRPLGNPRQLAISAFSFERLAGYGLMQRDRDFRSYEDLNGLFQQRPSAWIDTVGEWGPGRVELVEVPAEAEIYDNILSYWIPAEPVRAGQTWTCDYRISFGRGPLEPTSLARVVSTRSGRGSEEGERRFVVDFAGGGLADVRDLESITAKIEASRGRTGNILRQRNAFIGGVRLFFDFRPEEAPSEIRAALFRNGEVISETWNYQWRE